MVLLKRGSFQRDTGLMDEESYQNYLKRALPKTASEEWEQRYNKNNDLSKTFTLNELITIIKSLSLKDNSFINREQLIQKLHETYNS